MMRVRPAGVAGMFYPGSAHELQATVDRLLDDAGAAAAPPWDGPPVALIVPHAGYVYSGPTAATAYARLRPWRSEITRVVAVGPAHHVAVRGLVLSSADGFATPLGVVPADRDACDALLEGNGVSVDDRAHAPEHSVEVQVPFLQRVLAPGWRFVPVVAGSAGAAAVADALEPVWGAPGTLVVISSDLSHYLDIETARHLDRMTADAILRAAWEELRSEQACGLVPVRGALELARRHRQRVELLDLRTSGDTAGPRDRVVGYGSFVIR